MELVESEHLELKSKVTDRICRTIVAFANGSGGRIIVGIDDFGRVVGVDDIDAEMLRLSNLINDRICPELLQFVEIEPLELEDKRVICVHVNSGDEKPYYLADKGLCPAGVYVRLGPATVPLDRRGIRKMIRVADGVSWEDEQCRRQDLTFSCARRVFEEHGWEFADPLLTTLGIKGTDGFYTNLALLISDENPFEIGCASFNNDAFTEILSRRFCEGSIFDQLEAAVGFLDSVNPLRSYFVPGDLRRIDKYDYPPEAIREGVLNCIVHRDYDVGLGCPTLIKMNRTKLRFISHGGLCDITCEQALSGVSHTRNPRLQKLLLHLGIVESLGTGLQSIYELYQAEELTPEFTPSDNIVELVLPNLNTTRNDDLSPCRNDGANLRGSYEDYLELEKRGALPPDVEKAFESVKRRHQEALARSGGGLEATSSRARLANVRSENGPGASSAQEQLANMGVAIESFESQGSETTEDGLLVERTLIKLATTNGGTFTRKEAEAATGTGRDVTLRIINGMVERGELLKEGKARATRYRVAQ